VGLCGCYKRIFSFGDSIIDTGNFVYSIGDGKSALKEPPFGMTFFHHPTGRVSDGRVIVDFYGECCNHVHQSRWLHALTLVTYWLSSPPCIIPSAQAFQLPLLPPNLPQQNSGQFPTGANFAVFASTALPGSYFKPFNHSLPTGFNLGGQITWFKQMLQRIAPSDGK
jgi:hypothetical protein